MPIEGLPQFRVQAFDTVDKTHQTGNAAVRLHYTLLRSILTQCIQRPAVDLFLILIWVVASTSAALSASEDGTFVTIKANTSRKDPDHTAAALAVRMTWYLCPKEFSWKNEPTAPNSPLSVGQMAQKIGKPSLPP